MIKIYITRLPATTLKCICAARFFFRKTKRRMALSNIVSFVSLEGATELIDNADTIMKNYISFIKLIKEKMDLVRNVYDNLSWALGCLLDPEEGYIFLARQLAGLSTLVTDALKLKTEIPKEMVPKIERLKECVDKAKQAVQNMKDRIEPLLKV